MPKRVAIYTAIFGDFDSLKPQPRFPGVDYICFSDGDRDGVTGWKTVRCSTNGTDPRIVAKRYKTTPHLYLDAVYDYTIWIDGSISIASADFLSLCLDRPLQWGIACMRHPVGTCIYQEARGCADMPKYRRQRVIEQALHYKTQGYPGTHGLAACGIIVRDTRNEKVQRIGTDWFSENLMWTYQDQISFPYVLWKNQHNYDVLPFNYGDRSVFVLSDHTSER